MRLPSRFLNAVSVPTCLRVYYNYGKIPLSTCSMFFKIIVQKKAGIFTAETIKAKSLTQEVPGEKSWGGEW